MKGLSSMRGLAGYFEIGPRRIQGLQGKQVLEFELERQANGRLTDSCKEKLGAALGSFIKPRAWQPTARVACAIGAAGVSLRRLSVPAAGRDQFQRLLLLQIEKEFPLPPEELAWAWHPLERARPDGAARQEVLVVAVKKEVLEDYIEAFALGGLVPEFTLAALARRRVCPGVPENCVLLDAARGGTEIVVFEKGAPVLLRVFLGEMDSVGEMAAEFAVRSGAGDKGARVFVSGNAGPLKAMLERRSATVEELAAPSEEGTPALAGLRRAIEQARNGLLWFETKAAGGRAKVEPNTRAWAIAAVVLGLGLLLLPYVQAMVLKPLLARKVAALKAERQKLAGIDQELGFFEYLKQNQPPYLDALYLCAKSAPAEARFDSLTMNARGEVQLRGSMRNADQVSDFRSKLIATGFFSAVTVEDQSPTPDRQKVNVRIAAQFRPYVERPELALESPPEASKTKPKSDSVPKPH